MVESTHVGKLGNVRAATKSAIPQSEKQDLRESREAILVE